MTFMIENIDNTKSRRSKPVLCINDKTGFVVQYESAKEAAECLKIPKSNIAECLSEIHISTRGYRFVYGELNNYKAGKVRFPSKKNTERVVKKLPVIVFNPDTTVYGFYDSVTAAAKGIGSTPSSVSSCVLHKHNTTKGFIVVAGTEEEYKDGKIKYAVPQKHGKHFPIVQVSFGGIKVAEYSSAENAVEINSGYNASLILRCASHKLGSAYGFLWVYLDEWMLSKKR